MYYGLKILTFPSGKDTDVEPISKLIFPRPRIAAAQKSLLRDCAGCVESIGTFWTAPTLSSVGLYLALMSKKGL